MTSQRADVTSQRAADAVAAANGDGDDLRSSCCGGREPPTATSPSCGSEYFSQRLPASPGVGHLVVELRHPAVDPAGSSSVSSIASAATLPSIRLLSETLEVGSSEASSGTSWEGSSAFVTS